MIRKIVGLLAFCAAAALGQIDPTIPLKIKPVEIESSLNSALKVQRLQLLREAAGTREAQG